VTHIDYQRPDRPLPEDGVERLCAWLDVQRFAIVGAYHVIQVFPADGAYQETRQEDLEFELAEPPELHAPHELFRAVGLEMPSLFPPIRMGEKGARRSVAMTFATQGHLAAIRAAGTLIWERDPGLPRPEPATVDLVIDEPKLPAALLSDLRVHFEGLPQVRRAAFIRERLLLNGGEIWSETTLCIDAERAAPGSEASMQFSEAVFDVMEPYARSVEQRTSSWQPAAEDGLLVFDRGAT
jgi:hypothetical protein